MRYENSQIVTNKYSVIRMELNKRRKWNNQTRIPHDQTAWRQFIILIIHSDCHESLVNMPLNKLWIFIYVNCQFDNSPAS